MRAAAAPATRAIVNPREADHRSFDIAVAARIKQRRAGRAAGAPVFGNAVVGRDAEILVKFPIVEACAASPCPGSEACATRPDRRADPDSRDRACPGRTVRGAPVRPRASCLRIECARSRPAISADRQAASCGQEHSRAAQRQRADPAALIGISVRQVPGLFLGRPSPRRALLSPAYFPGIASSASLSIAA